MAKKIINVVYKVDNKELNQAKTSIQGVEKETKDAEKEMLKFGNTANKAGAQATQSFTKFDSLISNLSLVGFIAGLTAIGKKAIEITSEFQKLSAVLTNTLGSKSLALS